MSTTSPFFPYTKKNPAARLQLFCFPFAGGMAMSYRTWTNKLAPDIEVSPVELPGRGYRFREELFRGLEKSVPALTRAIREELDGRPFAFFGHSMGAALAFEVTHRLRSEGAPLPICLFLSGRGLAPNQVGLHLLSHDDLIARLRAYGGTPTEVLDNPELAELFLPILRADFTMTEAVYAPGDRPLLSMPIEALGGQDDEVAPAAGLPAWGALTSAAFHTTIFPGGHFYLREHEDAVLARVKTRIDALLSA